MARVREVGDNPNYPLDSDESLDEEGYCLMPGNDGEDHVRKTGSASAPFIGVNHKSSKEVDGYRSETLNTGGGPYPHGANDGGQGGMAVEQDGIVMMQAETGNEYNPGDAMFLSSTAGAANNADSGSDTRVGTVYKHTDHTNTDGSTALVPVNITGFIGE